jgi:hypothetical protein
LTTGRIFGVRLLPRPRGEQRICAHEVEPVESQLRDVAILLVIALLFVITLLALQLTRRPSNGSRHR